ncbi:MAG: CoA ester lyase [Thermoleophilia bacterium]|nr:CoA ester lyase [Thermoleophilia bacterium]
MSGGLLRSLLFAGATRPDLVSKLERSGADAVVIDLEDAVPAAAKDEARAALPALVESIGSTPVLVRINDAASAWFADDLEAVAALSLAGVVVPKAEKESDLTSVAERLDDGTIVLAGIESARGVAASEQLLEAGAGACYFGAEDYIADLGGRRSAGGDEVLYARSRVALAARLAGIPALDQVVIDFRDDLVFAADAEAGRAIGYRGKLCIHPSQVPIANRVFAASEEELRRARGMLAAWEEGSSRGVAAVEFEGEMVDGPAVRMARDTLERAG